MPTVKVLADDVLVHSVKELPPVKVPPGEPPPVETPPDEEHPVEEPPSLEDPSVKERSTPRTPLVRSRCYARGQ